MTIHPIATPTNSVIHPNYQTLSEFIALGTSAISAFYDLRDFNERSSTRSLEGVWFQGLMEAALQQEVSDPALRFIDELILSAKANQTISNEFLEENAYLHKRYDFDEGISIENESVEALRFYFKSLDNSTVGYTFRLQFPTRWFLALKDLSFEKQCAQIQHNLLNSPDKNQFALQIEAQASSVDPLVIKDVVGVNNLVNKDLKLLQKSLPYLQEDTHKLQELSRTPSFSTYERSREILPEIIQTTGYSLLVIPFAPHALALESIVAQRHVMDILKKSKYKPAASQLTS